MADPYPIPVGTMGTVEYVDHFLDGWNIGMRWDNGRTLSLCVPEDTFAVLRKEDYEAQIAARCKL